MNPSMRRNQLILICSMGLILITYLGAYWRPHRREIIAIENRIQETQQQISDPNQYAKQLSRLYAELGELKTQNASWKELIPSDTNVREFLTTVNSLTQRESVTVDRVTPQLVGELADLEQQPIRLTLVGSFPALVRVIYELETMSRIVEVTELDVDVSRGQRYGNTDKGGVFEANLTVKLFARRPASTDTAG